MRRRGKDEKFALSDLFRFVRTTILGGGEPPVAAGQGKSRRVKQGFHAMLAGDPLRPVFYFYGLCSADEIGWKNIGEGYAGE